MVARDRNVRSVYAVDGTAIQGSVDKFGLPDGRYFNVGFLIAREKSPKGRNGKVETDI